MQHGRDAYANANAVDTRREQVEDLKDLKTVMQRLSKPFLSIPNDQVWCDLGLDDEIEPDSTG